ncbi:MAG: glycerol kinase, partial [Moraxellaceae bacterium]
INLCIEKMIVALGKDITRIKAAGFAGQGSSLLCWDNQTGRPLTPVLSWQDIRGERYLKNIALSNTSVQSITGLRLSPHYGASKIRWCLEHSPAVKSALKNEHLCVGPIVSFIFWHLLDAKNNLVDPGHAQRTLLWSLQNHDWDESLLTIFHIPKNALPECRLHHSQYGSLGLNNHQIPFTVSARDQGASLFSRGLPDKKACYVNIGTGAFIQRVSENFHVPAGILMSPLYITTKSTTDRNNLYAWEATVNGAASALSFLQQQTGTEITAEQIMKALILIPQQPCYLLNAIGGLSSPYWRTDLESTFSENLSTDEKIVAWIESVIFQIAINIGSMNILGRAENIYISGGLSNTDAVCQKIADITKTRVLRATNVDATLQGIAFMASSVATEISSGETSEAWSPFTQDDVFLPTVNVQLLSRFERWEAAMNKWLTNN